MGVCKFRGIVEYFWVPMYLYFLRHLSLRLLFLIEYISMIISDHVNVSSKWGNSDIKWNFSIHAIVFLENTHRITYPVSMQHQEF